MEVTDAVKALYASLSDAQRREICLDWDFRDAQRGLVRTFVANHWQVTRPCIRGDFFGHAQQGLIHEAFRNLFDPAWYPRFLQQLKDDTGGQPWGTHQSVAIFGSPEDGGPCQFVMSGRHFTWRAEVGRAGSAAFGGPVLYGHQASGYYERADHPGNVFWAQAVQASRVAMLLDPAQLATAVVDRLDPETAIGFREQRPGLAVAALTADQRRELEATLDVLLDPFRATDRERVRQCLARRGGLDACHLMFARDGRMSPPWWDNWRLEGPAFVWHYRGYPHVHVWVHVAEDTQAPVNARSGTFIYAGHDPLQ